MGAPLTRYFTLTGDPVIDGMTHGYYWYLDSTKVVDYSISNGFQGQYWYSPSTVALYMGAALDTVSVYANIKFTYAGYYTDPYAAYTWGSEINLGLSQTGYYFNSNNTWAFGLFANSTYNTSPSYYPGAPGDIYLNLSSQGASLPSYEPGSQGWFLLLHELLHTLGLKHPHDSGGTGRPTFTQLGLGSFDINWATAMSYNDDASWNSFSWKPATPMALDVLALQYLYGKNVNYNTGDSLYTLTENNYFYTLWDAGGTDTLDASSAAKGWTIELPNVGLSSLVDTKVGFAVPTDEYYVTPHTLVWLTGDYENVIGSSYADVIDGNLFNNTIYGGAGNDLISGGAGNDLIYGGSGNDDFIYSASGNGIDTLTDLQSGDIITVVGCNFSSQATTGSGASLGLNQIQCELSSGNTYLYIGTDSTLGYDVKILLNGIFGSDQFSVSGKNITVVSHTNRLPSGSVTISGSLYQGGTLTASNNLADADGLGTISYQWAAAGINIAGATSNTFTLGVAQVGKAITVVASYIDILGATESVSSAATVSVANVNDLPTGTVTITGTKTQGQALTASNNLSDLDGLGSITYTWKANGTTVGTGTTYTLTQAEVGKNITATASYTDGYGTAEYVASSATSSVTNVNDLPTGAVTITGTATQGQTLTASNNLSDLDGLGSITYTWKANGSTIGTGANYTLTQAEVGKTITASASYTDLLGAAESAASNPTSSVANVNDLPTGAVTITGTATQGQTLTASNNLSDADGLGTITYTWKASGTSIGTGTTYTLTPADVGKTITATASYADVLGASESVASTATSSVANFISLSVSPSSVNEFGSTNFIYTFTRTGNTSASQTINFDVTGTANFLDYTSPINLNPDHTKSWTKLLGSNFNETSTALTTGTDGAIFVAEKTDLGLVYILKYQPDGTASWTKSLSIGNTGTASLTTGTDGAIYVSGSTPGGLDGQTNSGGYDVFVTKYLADGTKSWTKLLGTSSGDFGNALNTGTDGAIYVTGETNGNLDGQTNNGGYDVFITKYLPDGTKSWTKLLGVGDSFDSAKALTTGNDGAIYVGGWTEGNLDGQTNSGGGADAFVTKFLPDGTKSWTKLLGTNLEDITTALATGTDGAIYVGGYTTGNLDGQTNSGGYDVFITKYLPDGTKSWTKLLGTSSFDISTALTTGTDGAIYVSGYTLGNLDGQSNSGGGGDAFITKYQPDGTKSWTKVLGSSSYDVANALTTGIDGAIYVSGETDGNFDGQTNIGGGDAFITKYQGVSPQITFAVGSSTATLVINPKADSITEGNETVVISIAQGDGYELGATSTATGTISDFALTISGTATQGQTLTAINNLAVTDSLESITYQWKAAGVNIAGATSNTFTLGASQIGKAITVVASYTDLLGSAESVASSASASVAADTIAPTLASSIPADNATSVYLSSNLSLTFSEPVYAGSGNIVITDLGNVADNRTIAVTDTTQVSFSGSVVTINPTANLLPGAHYAITMGSGVIVDNASNPYAGISSSTALDFTAATTADLTGAVYHWKSHVLMDSVSVTPQGGSSVASNAGRFAMSLVVGDYNLTASKTATTDSTGSSAITSADALAALKIAVGINPNSANALGVKPALSPYQLMAADINGDGQVTSADALAILKMAVNLPTAATPTWIFADESQVFSLSASSVSYSTTMSKTLNANQTVNMVAVLKGDVNGSWGSADAASTRVDYSDPTYFATLANNLHISQDVWGIG